MVDFYYQTSSGTRVNLLQKPYITESIKSVLSYSWNIVTAYNRIASFNRSGLFEKPIFVSVTDTNPTATAAAKDYLFSLFESDVIAGVPGRLYCNGYYLNCYIIGDEVQTRLLSINQSAYKIVTDNAVWYKELKSVFFSPTVIEDIDYENQYTVTDEKGYDYGYDYGYGNPAETQTFNNPATNAAQFRLVVNGAWENPSITISGHIYNVNVDLANGEQLIIDSTNKEIYKISGTTRTNCFSLRNKALDKKPFVPIPAGENSVSWEGEHSFILTLIDERSAPKWS